MKKSHQKGKSALITLLVLVIVSFAVFAAGLVLFHWINTGRVAESILNGENGDGGLVGTLNLIKQAYLLPFDPEQCQELMACYQGEQVIAIIISSLVYVLSGITLIGIVLGVIYVSVKKHPAKIFYVVCLLAALLAGHVILTSGSAYIEVARRFAEGDEEIIAKQGLTTTALGTLIGGILVFVFVWITYISGIDYAKANVTETEEVEEIEEMPVVAEENSEPVAVQEAEAILLESEVEPEPEEEVVETEPEEAVEEPTEEPVVEAVEEPAPVVVAEEVKEEPAPAPAQEPKVEVNVNNAPAQQAPAIDQNSLAALLKEVVRDIVRDELARTQANQQPVQQQMPQASTITGATFGGPLVVQYFNGGIQGVTPAPVQQAAQVTPSQETVVEAPAQQTAPKAEEPAPAPVAEKVKEEPAPAPEVAPAPVAVEEPKEVKVYERLSFAERLLQSDKDLQKVYNELKNEILSYGVKSRISAVGDTFRLHKKVYVRITVAGKSLKLYFALDPKDYENSKIPVQDASHKGMYEEMPLVFKVKSDLSIRRCKELIQAVMEKDSLEQGEIAKTNWIKELKAELKAGKDISKED